MAHLLQRIQDRLVGILRAVSVLLAGTVDVIIVRVDDVPWANEGRRRLADGLRAAAAEELALQSASGLASTQRSLRAMIAPTCNNCLSAVDSIA